MIWILRKSETSSPIANDKKRAIWQRIVMLRIVLFALALLIGTAPAGADAPASQPSPVRYHEEVRADPPLHLHVVTVDLTDPTVSIRVVRGGEDPDGDGP